MTIKKDVARDTSWERFKEYFYIHNIDSLLSLVEGYIKEFGNLDPYFTLKCYQDGVFPSSVRISIYDEKDNRITNYVNFGSKLDGLTVDGTFIEKPISSVKLVYEGDMPYSLDDLHQYIQSIKDGNNDN
jgi:hypothetical protein